MIGTPYLERGRDPAHGLDCWGLVLQAFAAYGHTIPDIPPGLTPLVWRMRQAETGQWVPEQFNISAPQLVSIRSESGAVDHAAVGVGFGQIVHALEGQGVVVQTHRMWRSKMVGVYAWIGH